LQATEFALLFLLTNRSSEPKTVFVKDGKERLYGFLNCGQALMQSDSPSITAILDQTRHKDGKL
jgi:hypothetical protein